MFSDPVEIAYRTTIEVPRSGRIGGALRWLGEHPVWGGFLCGLGVVFIAALRRPQGIAAEPMVAAIISALVVITWMILFYLMRRFFTAQSFASETVLREIYIDEKQAQWLQNKEPLRQIDAPRIEILTTPVPQGIGETDQGRSKKATPWPIWIAISDDTGDQRLIFETRDSARRARDYAGVSNDIIDDTDERLPRAIAAPILQRLYSP